MLVNIRSGTNCFVDANIFFYHLTAATTDVALSNFCSDFLERIDKGEVIATTSTVAIAEAVHKVMLAEAKVRYDSKLNAARLQRQRHLIATLSEHKKVAELVRALKIQVEPITLDLLERAADCSIQHQLLTNDALTIAVMEKLRLTDIATNDDDFDSVAHLTVWKPR
ncbi:MAG: type II toxin-antitoxin system VapC family toxin [Blastocatellia bacterium]